MSVEGKRGLTLLETMMAISIVAVMMTAMLVGLNVKTQLARGIDGKRKNDLSMLGKALEDFQGDHNRFPKGTEICHDAGPTSTSCHICGDIRTPAEFMSYAKKLPCDRGGDGYFYVIDDASHPLKYKIYTKLDNPQDQSIGEVGCRPGCPGNPAYNYGIYSGSTSL